MSYKFSVFVIFTVVLAILRYVKVEMGCKIHSFICIKTLEVLKIFL